MKILPKDWYINTYFLTFIIIILPLIINIILFIVSRFTKTVIVKKIYDLKHRRSNALMFEDSDGTNYTVSNLWFLGKFNSLEEWNKLKVGQKYQIKGYSYRVGFLGMYPKIYEIQSI